MLNGDANGVSFFRNILGVHGIFQRRGLSNLNWVAAGPSFRASQTAAGGATAHVTTPEASRRGVNTAWGDGSLLLEGPAQKGGR